MSDTNQNLPPDTGLINVIRVVLEMRKAQKTYFRTRGKADLIAAKRLETAVDVRLGELGIKDGVWHG